MDLHLDTSLAIGYHAKSQQARVITEDWMARNMYCPICSESHVRHLEANKPVEDFLCDKCKAQYELKSKDGKFSLDDIYSFEEELKQKHPENNFIKDKLRQQLQMLRDKGLIEFLNRGHYRKL